LILPSIAKNSSRNSTKNQTCNNNPYRLKSRTQQQQSQARKQRDPINPSKTPKHRHTQVSPSDEKTAPPPLHQPKKKKNLLQGFEFSLQERSGARASKKKLCCKIFSLVLRPDAPCCCCSSSSSSGSLRCEASERASENWGKQKSNRRAAAVDLRMGPAASLAALAHPL